MTANESPTVGDVFELLNRWRHLPFYSLETRAAPFFALFLRDVLSETLNVEIHETVIPEFPLRIGSLYTTDEERKELDAGRNQSFNVDYVAFAKDKSTAFLVELKTDMGSKRDEQDKYLGKARDVEFNLLVRGVRKLAKASNSKQKYVHLLHQLSLAKFVCGNEELCELYKKSFSKCRVVPGWTRAIDGLKMGDTICSKTKVVFIQPKPDPKLTKGKSDACDFEYICFKKVAEIVQTKGELGKLFAQHLRQWVKEAGSPDPRKIHRS